MKARLFINVNGLGSVVYSLAFFSFSLNDFIINLLITVGYSVLYVTIPVIKWSATSVTVKII